MKPFSSVPKQASFVLSSLAAAFILRLKKQRNICFLKTAVQTHILIRFWDEKYTVPKTAVTRVTMTLNLAFLHVVWDTMFTREEAAVTSDLQKSHQFCVECVGISSRMWPLTASWRNIPQIKVSDI